MLIKSIELYNFRQFKDKQTLTFSCDPEKNVTILLGDNTFGKTTILQAFNWCLYNKANFPKDSNPDFLLNLEVAKENKGAKETCSVYVEIILEHKGCEYTIRRTEDYYNYSGDEWRPFDNKPEITWKDNGIAKSVPTEDCDKIIKSILPESLSEYFFFDTERVSDIGTKKDLPDAVQGLLGLAPVKNARIHLGKDSQKSTVIGKWYSALDENGDERGKQAKTVIEQKNEEKTKLKEKHDDLSNEIDTLTKQKENLDQIIRDNQDTAELQKRKEVFENELENNKRDIENYETTFKKYFGDNIVNYLLLPLIDNAEGFLKGANVEDKGIREMTATSIADIIKRGKCICGAEIKKGDTPEECNEAYRHILEELRFLPPESIGTSIRNYKNLIENDKNYSKQFFEILENQYRQIINTRSKISGLEDKIKEIEINISDKHDMKDYEGQVEKIKTFLKEKKNAQSEIIKKIGACENEIQSARKVLDSLIASNENNDRLIKCIAYAQEICDWIDEAYGKKEAEIRESLQERVNNIFSEMYHGDRRVTIDDNYKVTLYSNVDGVEIASGESEGLKRVKNFAFISGLVDLAKEKASMGNDKNSLKWENEPYPLVMDAPFSNADETHIQHISKVLPRVANQVIMFVMKKDWHYAKDVMQVYVGKECSLVKKTETCTVIQD